MRVDPELKQELRTIKRLRRKAAHEIDVAYLEELEEEYRRVQDAIIEYWEKQSRKPANLIKTCF
jgi:hypothetical protein